MGVRPKNRVVGCLFCTRLFLELVRALLSGRQPHADGGDGDDGDGDGGGGSAGAPRRKKRRRAKGCKTHDNRRNAEQRSSGDHV